MQFNWRPSFPYPEPREIQSQALQILQDNWDRYDVFVMRAPTAFGKTALARTLMNSLHSVSVITPTNLLVNQFLDEFPDTPTLSRMDSYYCEEWKRPCIITRNKLLKYCKGCSCGKDIATAKFRRGPGIYNYHTYLSHKLYRDVLVVDEAHNLIPVLKDHFASLIWQHDYKYPSNMFTADQIANWITTLPENKQNHKKIDLLRESVSGPNPRYVAQRSKEWFNGKGTIRGQPEERDCIRLLPVDIADQPPIFWPGLGHSGSKGSSGPGMGKPGGVQKVVLLSATISRKDIECLGLEGGRKRVCYIDCKSPISPGVRPIILDRVMGVNRHNMEEAGTRLASYIEELATFHAGEKGIIHATYQMASILAKHLTGSRYLFHSRQNKGEQYRLFRESAAKGGRILIACGLYEGIDLPEDAGRWQVIGKIPWQSLGSPAVKHLADRDPEWMLWETMKTVIQACGRICRTPEDYGVTYIFDSTVDKLFEAKHLMPEWWLEAIV